MRVCPLPVLFATTLVIACSAGSPEPAPSAGPTIGTAPGTVAEATATPPTATAAETTQPNTTQPATPQPGETTQSAAPDAGPIPAALVAARVKDATQRLEATPAGTILLSAIDAHGGLATWLAAGTIDFSFDYAPLGKPDARRHTRNQVDLWRARARQTELGDGADATLGWDGAVSWITPSPDAFPSSARFWATTPYYFVGIPFVLADPGAQVAALPDADHDGRPHHVLKVTYAAGTGDSPDDYYVVLVDADTRRVSAIRYVVAYPTRFKAGEHSPEKLMRYEGLTRVDGLLLPTALPTFAWDPATGTVGDKVTDITVRVAGLGDPLPAATFAPPDGAVVSSEL